MKDFTPTKDTITLHGLGFIQVVLPANQRMHVWHPDLPRRDCYVHSAIHNHRFSTHDLISHNGPRSAKGGRISYPVATCNVHEREVTSYGPGEEYVMPIFGYHHTPNDGVVVTIMRKIEEDTAIHANSVCRRGVDFHYDFDRFQMAPERLFEFVLDALGGKMLQVAA